MNTLVLNLTRLAVFALLLVGVNVAFAQEPLPAPLAASETRDAFPPTPLTPVDGQLATRLMNFAWMHTGADAYQIYFRDTVTGVTRALWEKTYAETCSGPFCLWNADEDGMLPLMEDGHKHVWWIVAITDGVRTKGPKATYYPDLANVPALLIDHKATLVYGQSLSWSHDPIHESYTLNVKNKLTGEKIPFSLDLSYCAATCQFDVTQYLGVTSGEKFKWWVVAEGSNRIEKSEKRVFKY